MRRTETRTIDGAKYEIRSLAPFSALRVQAQLAKMFGEPLARLIAETDSIAGLFSLDLDGDGRELLAAAVSVGCDKLDPDLVVSLAESLVVGNVSGEHNGNMVDIDSADTYEYVLSQHDPWHQLRLLQACIAVQFLPPGAGARTAPAEAPAEAAG